jgi:lipase chaperone LimK
VRVSHQRGQISVRARFKYHKETHFGCDGIILQGENVTLAAKSLFRRYCAIVSQLSDTVLLYHSLCRRYCAIVSQLSILSRLSTLVNTMKLIARRYNALNALNTELATQKHSFDIG